MYIRIVHGSKDGQTTKIAESIAQIIPNRSLKASTCSGKEISAGFATDAFHAAIVGGSIHAGRYPAHLREFVTQRRD